MKKKVFRTKYNMVNGNGEVIKEGLTIEDINKMECATDTNSKVLKVKAVKLDDKKDYSKKQTKKSDK